ncbi:testis-expressed protein 36 [Lacerta agilis]|uniref:testis-expressed protein 36 n=1 Tax=Lacerta agilis TaxID=80427 RepID=UPI0014195638|nr:testis-expressed protein 36 [Lacerta agilis]
MPKGRRANPSTARDGAWFAQSGKVQIFPESLTASMQKQILNLEATNQINNRLPQMYKVREKKPVKTFPFSIHDNRHCLLNVGEYLDSGLGLRKFQREACQHHSESYLFLAHEPIPSTTDKHTIYQTSFVEYPNTKRSILGRFPKSHADRSFALNSSAANDYLWFSKGHDSPNISAPVRPEKSSLSEPQQLLPAEHPTE